MGSISARGAAQSGAGQATAIWGINGINYRETINDNMLVVIMIETPTGVANAFDIASVPGVDVVIIGNNDLSSFSGLPQTDDRYHALVKKVHDDVIRAGKIFGQAAANYATGPYSYDAKFFQERQFERRLCAARPRGCTDERERAAERRRTVRAMAFPPT